MNYSIAQSTQPDPDPWQPYAKKKPKPSIPEPATFLAITLCLLIVLAARWGRATKP